MKKCTCVGHKHDGSRQCLEFINTYDSECCLCTHPPKMVSFSQAFEKIHMEKEAESWEKGKWGMTAADKLVLLINSLTETLDKFLPEIDEEKL